MPYIGRQLVRGQNREIDDISSSFNGSTTAFTLQTDGVNTQAGSANQLFVCLGGVMQNPNTDYTVDASTITFTTAPASGLTFWALIQGDTVDINTAADGSITTVKLGADAVTSPKLATQTGNVDWSDAGKARFGTHNDLEIFHNGTESWIKDTGTGDLNICANDLQIKNADDDEFYITAVNDGAVSIYHDNTIVLNTTGNGVQVTGTTTSYALDVQTAQAPAVRFYSTKATDEGVEVNMYKNSASPADDDQLGYIQFSGNDDTGTNTLYAAIIAYSPDVSNGAEGGELRIYIRDNSSFSQKLKIAEDGTFTGSSSNDISDQRLKENITLVSDPITKIKALKGRTFTWKPEAKLPAGTHYGFIAQEVEGVVADLVDNEHGIRQFDKDGNLIPENDKATESKEEGVTYAKSVNAIGVVPILVEALKEALTRIETLETKVEALEKA